MKKRQQMSKRSHIKLFTNQSMVVLAVDGLAAESDDADHVKEEADSITTTSSQSSSQSSSVRIVIKLQPSSTTHSLNYLRHSLMTGLFRSSSHTRNMLSLYLFTLPT